MFGLLFEDLIDELLRIGFAIGQQKVKLLMQFDLTWDLHLMSETQLIAMLPAEFDEFR